jgi:hypothetical protein
MWGRIAPRRSSLSPFVWWVGYASESRAAWLSCLERLPYDDRRMDTESKGGRLFYLKYRLGPSRVSKLCMVRPGDEDIVRMNASQVF